MTDKQLSFGNTSIAFADKSTKQLKKTAFLFALMGVPELTKIGTFLIKTSLKLNFPIKKIVKNTLFRQFCGGETLDECQIVINQLDKIGIKSIPDYSAEGESDEKNFVANTEIIRTTIGLAAKQKAIGFTVFKVTGLGPASVLEKVQRGEILDEKESMALERIRHRVYSLCEMAFLSKVKILADAEESWIQDTIDNMILDMMKRFNKQMPVVFNTYQMYKTGSIENLKFLTDLAAMEGFKPAAKIVRGAYLEKENKRAEEMGYTSPLQINKPATDKAFNDALEFCVKNNITLCAGSHNEESNMLLIKLMQEHNIPPYSDKIYFAQLYGMSDHISYNLARAGYNVAKYLPFGPVASVMPYLFRRAEENKSVTGQTGRELALIRQELNRRKSLK